MILALILFLSAISLSMYFYTEKINREKKKLLNNKLERERTILEKLQETAKELERVEQEFAGKATFNNLNIKGKIQPGTSFKVDIDSTVIKIFFYEDKEFAIVCPTINERYVDLPGVVEVAEGRSISWSDVENIEEGVVKKGIELYKAFRKENKAKFIKAIS